MTIFQGVFPNLFQNFFRRYPIFVPKQINPLTKLFGCISICKVAFWSQCGKKAQMFYMGSILTWKFLDVYKRQGLDRIIQESYSLLGLISFLTAGKQEVRAWTIKKGTKAPQAAGKIHTDFERGFIRDVYKRQHHCNSSKKPTVFHGNCQN